MSLPAPDEASLAELARESLERCDVLAACTEEAGIIKRTFLSAPMKDVHRELGGWMVAAGMTVRVDAMGNIIGRLPAEREDAPVVLMGSHLDTVPDAGKYDGILGVVAGVALARLLRDRGVALPYHLDLIGFSEEEGVRFSTPYLGSRAIAGKLEAAQLAARDANGLTVAEAVRAFGGDPELLPAAAYDFDRVRAFVELHIEQGPVLESEDLSLGAVTSIAGQHRLRAAFTGRANHAGTAPMNLRQDAFAGLAELSVFMERFARESTGLVATIGIVQVEPGGQNVVPGRAYFSLDIRHGSQQELDAAGRTILEAARGIAQARGLDFMIEREERQPVAPCDAALVAKLGAALQAAGHADFRLVSGAGHDAAVLSQVTPTVMLFMRSPAGLSHHPEESVRAEDLAAALKALYFFFSTLE